MKRTAGLWLLIGLIGYALLPWYLVGDPGFWRFGWLADPLHLGPSALVSMLEGRWWLAAPLVGFAAAAAALGLGGRQLSVARGLVASGVLGLFLMAAQGLLILGHGPRLGIPEGASQPGMGAGALVVAAALLFVLTTGVSGLGRGRGDAFITGLVGAIVALVGLFVFYPMAFVLVRAFELRNGAGFGVSEFFPRLFSPEV